MAITNGRMKRPRSDRMIEHSLVYDSYPRYVTDSPSPSKFAALLKRVDSGELSDLCLLQQEMERKSDQFAGVVQTRRNAVTALEWRIEPEINEDEEGAFAKEVADYIGDKLATLKNWSTALRHLSEAIGPNLAVIELIWEKAELVDLVIVPCTRLVSHPFTNTGVSIRTDDQYMGWPTEDFPGKFIVYVPNARGGFPFRTTLTHASVGAYLMIHFSRVDWLAFSEAYGSATRVVNYDDDVVDMDRDTLIKYANEGGADAAIVMPKGATLEFMQAVGTGETYQKQLDYADSKLAILWLGQTLTTDVGGVGSFAAAKVHDNVRGDLLASDLQSEASCIREQLIRPMVELRYPGKSAPIPCFKRKTYKQRDIEAERLTLDQLRFAREGGIRIDEDVIYEKLNLPRPETAPIETDDDAVNVTFNELTLGIERATTLADLALVNALRAQIGKMIGVEMPPLTELPKPVARPGQPSLESGKPVPGDDDAATQ